MNWLTLPLIGILGLSLAAMRRQMKRQADAIESRERLLNEAQERLQLALDGAEEAFWDWNIVQNRTHYNDRWATMLGFAPEEIGEHVDIWERLVHPDDIEGAKAAIAAHFAGETERYQHKYRLRCKDGTWRWILARGKVMVRGAAGEPLRMAGTHVDITDHYEMAAELAQARDEAEAASHAKSRFLANMSHEIRTPLNAVVGLAGLLADGARDGRDRQHADIIRTASETLLAILNDLLDVSKIEAGQMQLESIPFDVRKVVEEAGVLFSAATAEKNLALEIDIAADVPLRVLGDPLRLRQILANLVSNAIRFTARGEVRITCRLDDTQPPGGTRLAFAVRDTGIGIAPDHLARLFHPFSQADDSTTRRFGGTGLGLAICKHLTGMMNGSIGVESEEGRGSLFHFAIQVASAAPASDVEHRNDELTAGPGAHVLLVEDNRINQLVAGQLLRRLGYSFDTACDGLEAIAAARSTYYDLILMDCQMPNCNGYQASTEIRRAVTEQSARAPIVALTANALSDEREKCLSAGMDDYLAKPVTLETLSRTLRKWLPDGGKLPV